MSSRKATNYSYSLVKRSRKQGDGEKNWICFFDEWLWKAGKKAESMIRKRGEQMRNRKGKESPGNQRSSRRTFCHNSLNVALIFTDVLPHDSHQFADTFIYTSVSSVCLSPKGPSLCSQSLSLTPYNLSITYFITFTFYHLSEVKCSIPVLV